MRLRPANAVLATATRSFGLARTPSSYFKAWSKAGYPALGRKKMGSKISLPKSFVFHCLRHTYASLLLRSNTPPIVVARQLGHLNIETTLRTYGHVTDDFMDHEFRAGSSRAS